MISVALRKKHLESNPLRRVDIVSDQYTNARLVLITSRGNNSQLFANSKVFFEPQILALGRKALNLTAAA